MVTAHVNTLDGFNDLTLVAYDDNGHFIKKDFSFFTGSRRITVDILDASDINAINGTFKVIDTKTNTEFSITEISNNQFIINNTPARDFYLYFLRENGHFAGKRISSSETDVDIYLRGLSVVSATANPDLVYGSQGWTLDSDYVEVISVDGKNQFQVSLDLGENTEYSHAFTATQRFLSYPLRTKGNIVNSHTNVILRNYTQKTIAARSLSPADKGYDQNGESFDISSGSVSLEANTGDQLEIIVQVFTPPAPSGELKRAGSLLYSTEPALILNCHLDEKVYGLQGSLPEAHALKYLSVAQTPVPMNLYSSYPIITGTSAVYRLVPSGTNACLVDKVVLGRHEATAAEEVISAQLDGESRSFTMFRFNNTSSLLNDASVSISLKYRDYTGLIEKEKSVVKILRKIF